MKNFLIIDGNAIVHRAFHALPPLTDSQGRMVNAVYGFFSMLLKVMDEVSPDYIIVCFDRPKPTFRKTLFAGYQAHRPTMADGLSEQFGILHKALEDNNIAIYELDGYEADDVIGTLTYQIIQNSKFKIQNENKEEDIQVKIVTGDRDLLQLVNEKVHILFPILGITKMVEYDEEKVVEKFGVKPSQFIDYKALIGDASDGYPGVSGIGPKTAANLLQKFGSFEHLYKNLQDVTPTTAEKLATDAEQAALARTLATIVTDAPVTLHLEECSFTHLDKETMAKVFDELSFESLKKRLDSLKLIKRLEERKKEKNHGAQMSLL